MYEMHTLQLHGSFSYYIIFYLLQRVLAITGAILLVPAPPAMWFLLGKAVWFFRGTMPLTCWDSPWRLAHLSGNRQTFSCPQHHVWSRQDLVLFSKGHHFGTVATVLTVVNTLLPRTLTSPMRFQCECRVRHGLVVQSLIICGPFGSWRGFSKNTMLHRSWWLPWPIIYSCKWSVPSPRLGNSLTKLQFSHLPALCRVKLKPGASCTIASGMHMLIIWVKYGISHLKSSYVDGIPSTIN